MYNIYLLSKLLPCDFGTRFKAFLYEIKSESYGARGDGRGGCEEDKW